MTSIVLRNALVLDTVAGELLADRDVLVVDGRIEEIADGRIHAGDAHVVEVGGRVLMPGLCDAHVHITAATMSLEEIAHWSPYYATARALERLQRMLLRGFTTVRDACGADYGLAAAVEEGYIPGPRVLHCGKALSQTGGHGDMRERGDEALDQCYTGVGIGRICDGVAEVRRAARDELRKGAKQVKMMVSGGIGSPLDPVDIAQFSLDEIRAGVEEAEAAGRYVMAHAYPARAINRALRCGVRSIEHGNLMDEESADLFLEKDAFLVPTLSAYETLARDVLDLGMPKKLFPKVFDVLHGSMTSLELAHRRGVKMAYGTDLIGPTLEEQCLEFSIRTQVQKPIDVIRSATTIAADLFQMPGEIGVVAPGARADLLVVDGNPLEDVGCLQNQGRDLKLIMKDGVLVKNE